MENKRGSEIFLGVVGVATLLVAIIGATFAYFSATAESANGAINVGTTTLSLGYGDHKNNSGDNATLKQNMIPATYAQAKAAAFLDRTEAVTSGNNQRPGRGLCEDDNGNVICSVYRFRIANPNASTQMTISGRIKSVVNEGFKNLAYALFEGDFEGEDGKSIYKTIEALDNTTTGYNSISQGYMPQQGQESAFIVKGTEDDETPTPLTRTLIGFAGNEATPDKNPYDSSYKLTTTGGSNYVDYTLLIWLNEADANNVDEAGLSFAASIVFDTGSGQGVTGVIGNTSSETFGATKPEVKVPAA